MALLRSYYPRQRRTHRPLVYVFNFRFQQLLLPLPHRPLSLLVCCGFFAVSSSPFSCVERASRFFYEFNDSSAGQEHDVEILTFSFGSSLYLSFWASKGIFAVGIWLTGEKKLHVNVHRLEVTSVQWYRRHIQPEGVDEFNFNTFFFFFGSFK